MKSLFMVFIWVSFGACLSSYGNDEVRQAFEDYVEQRTLFFSLPPGKNGVHESAFVASREDLYKLGEEAIEFFAAELSSTTKMGYRVEILDFLAEDGFGKAKVLPVVRKLVTDADLEESYPAVVAACVRYLGKNGSPQDIQLLRRLNKHRNPGVVLAAEVGIKQLKGVAVGSALEEKGNFSAEQKRTEKDEESAKVHHESDGDSHEFATRTSNGETSRTSLDEERGSKWPFVVGVIAALGILILLVRAKRHWVRS